MDQPWGPLTIRDVEEQVYPAIEPILRRVGRRPIDLRNRDDKKLTSALSAPFAGFNGQDAYEGLLRKAAAYLYLVAKAHAFFDGNKRIAVVSCLYFLFQNDLWLGVDPVDFYQFTKRIVRSKKGIDYNIDRIEKYLKDNTGPLEDRLRAMDILT